MGGESGAADDDEELEDELGDDDELFLAVFCTALASVSLLISMLVIDALGK